MNEVVQQGTTNVHLVVVVVGVVDVFVVSVVDVVFDFVVVDFVVVVECLHEKQCEEL